MQGRSVECGSTRLLLRIWLGALESVVLSCLQHDAGSLKIWLVLASDTSNLLKEAMPRKRKHGGKHDAASASGAINDSNHFSPPRAFEQRAPPLIKPSLLNLFGSSLRPSTSTSTATGEGPPECYRDECATSIVFTPYCRPTIYKRCPVRPPPSYRSPTSATSGG